MFDNIQNGNVIHWTCMIAVYVQRGRVTQALEIFSKMHEKGLNPNNVTLFNVLSACSSLEALVMGQFVHKCIIESELETDHSLLNALFSMYSKCGHNGCLRRSTLKACSSIIYSLLHMFKKNVMIQH